MDKLEYERKFIEKGYTLVAGVDEVGRGPLAGPVVTAAVIMPLREGDIILGIDDSKKLSEKKRKELAEIIKERAIAYEITEIQPEEIDEINILNAVKKCMTLSVKNLKIKPSAVIVDGVNTNLDLGDVESLYLVKGDQKSYTVGCASIIAKVYRDELMGKYAQEYSGYGFEKHKGYGTATHISAIKEKGPCKLHRKTFIKNFWAE
ncbi:MAG: ribonuclease HII [Clostridia bacterium]|nr:ribonuclease HII [Clostridia bacterium]